MKISNGLRIIIKVLGVGLSVVSATTEVGMCMDHKEIRVRRNLVLPIDPLKIQSMGDYDFTLLTSRNWFEYDSARRAVPGILESWTFDSVKGAYHFKISKLARWSNGNQIKASELIQNLKRAFQSGSSYGKSILALIDIEKTQISNDLEFSIHMQNKKPSDSFFERMGSIFLAIVHPSDLNQDLSMKSNSIAAGPFVMSEKTSDEIRMKPNPYFPNSQKDGPTNIVIRNTTSGFSLKNFCAGKTWENYVQTYSYLPHAEAEEILNAKMPLWTRSYDRISLFRIGNGNKNRTARQETLKELASAFAKSESVPLPLNLKKAESLQPPGFALYDNLKLHELKSKTPTLKEIRILAIEGLAAQFHAEILKPLFEKLKVKPVWDYRPLNEFIQRLTTDESYDLALLSFGVADPEPSTWMSLVMDSQFVHVLPEEKKRFESALKAQDRNQEVRELKEILSVMSKRGSYFPLYWGSTLSIGQKGMSFERIRELDETVDLSKVIFKK